MRSVRESPLCNSGGDEIVKHLLPPIEVAGTPLREESKR
jgi:hypothetical protein